LNSEYVHIRDTRCPLEMEGLLFS